MRAVHSVRGAQRGAVGALAKLLAATRERPHSLVGHPPRLSAHLAWSKRIILVASAAGQIQLDEAHAMCGERGERRIAEARAGVEPERLKPRQALGKHPAGRVDYRGGGLGEDERTHAHEWPGE